MTVNTEKQIVGFLNRQKAMILSEESFEQRCLLIAMWKGFLIGMQITNAISIKEYRQLEREIKDFTERLN